MHSVDGLLFLYGLYDELRHNITSGFRLIKDVRSDCTDMDYIFISYPLCRQDYVLFCYN